MGVKLYKAVDGSGLHYGWAFFCPGCGHGHVYWTERAASNGAKWSFNGDLENPTFRASLVQTDLTSDYRCHIFVTDGKIEFLKDCSHHLAGQTIEMEDIE